MFRPRPASRRAFLLAGAATAWGAQRAAGASVPGATAASASPSARAPIWQRVQAELARLGPAIAHHDRVGVADFSAASQQPRFHLLDLEAGTLRSFLVAHGRGSDPSHSGWLQRFSNEFGSNASSEGAYRTGELYSGKHGRSMRLAGLDPSNDNAEGRAIVIHSAWYVDPRLARERGKLGRSEGCFVFSPDEVDTVMGTLGPGRLLLAGRF